MGEHVFDTWILMNHWSPETHWDVILLKELGSNITVSSGVLTRGYDVSDEHCARVDHSPLVLC